MLKKLGRVCKENVNKLCFLGAAEKPFDFSGGPWYHKSKLIKVNG